MIIDISIFRLPPVATRQQIAAKVRELRESRRWTQKDLAGRLGLSQSRLSEIERGDGSFTAEQFLVLLRLFNVGASHFTTESGSPDLALQNVLARLGAAHLQESEDALPSEKLEDVHAAIREAVVNGAPRMVTALAPVFVRNAERLNLVKLYADLERAGLERRLGWSVANTLAAIELIRVSGGESREWSRLISRAAVTLRRFLDFIGAESPGDGARHMAPDVLDANIRSRRSLDSVLHSRTVISKQWNIASALKVEDFLEALKAASAAR
jgi:transcriptional regulator with XRE-family HTH domain